MASTSSGMTEFSKSFMMPVTVYISFLSADKRSILPSAGSSPNSLRAADSVSTMLCASTSACSDFPTTANSQRNGGNYLSHNIFRGWFSGFLLPHNSPSYKLQHSQRTSRPFPDNGWPAVHPPGNCWRYIPRSTTHKYARCPLYRCPQ